MPSATRRGVCAAVFVLATLAAAGPAFAGTTGKLTGKVTGGASSLAGVTVTATSPTQIGGPQVTRTNAQGEYTFPTLSPGVFAVTFALEGFSTQQAAAVTVRLDGTTELDAQLSTSQVTETITVTGEAPIVDPEQVSLSQTFTVQYLEKAAIGSGNRSYQAVLGQTAGVVGTGNPNVLGSTQGENAFYIDGVNTTDPVTATFGVNFNFDAIQEIDFHTAGFAAEYGGATGGLVNLVTKSGGNRFGGTFDVRYRTNHYTEKGTYFDPDQRKEKFLTPGLTLGGPLLTDRLWFFAAYQYTDSERTPERAPTTRKFEGNYYLGKLTWAINPSWLASAKLSVDPAEISNLNSGARVLPEATSFQEQGTKSFQTELSGALRGSLLWNLRSGIHRQELNAFPQSRNLDLAGHTDVSGAQPSSVNYTNTQYSNRDRDQLLSDLTWFLQSGPGTHEIKGGIEWDALKFKTHSYTPSGYRYEDNGHAPLILWYEPDAGAAVAKGTQYAGFLQDSWKVDDHLSISAGLRYDEIAFQNDVGTEVAKYQKAQPRLGIAWDILGNATTVARLSWGRFMHPNALTMPSFAKQTSLPVFRYISCTYSGRSRSDCQAFYSGTLTAGGITLPRWIDDPQHLDPNGYRLSAANVFSSAPNEIQPGLDPTYADTLVVGIERQIGRRTSLELSYVDKSTKDVFEDTCNGNVPTPTADGPCDYYVMANLPGLKRDYKGLILKLESRAFDWLNLLGSYTYSKSRGNVEYTQNAGADFDVYPVHYVNTYGCLSDDRRHRVKLNGYVDLPLAFTLGVQAYWSSPFTYSKTQSASPYGTEFLAPRGAFRANANYQLDLELRKAFEIGRVRPQLIATVLNVLGSEQITSVCGNAAGCGEDRPFGSADDHGTPRRYEIGFRLEF